MLPTILVGLVLVWLCEAAEQFGLISELTHSALKALFWSAAMGALLYIGRRSQLPRGAMIALVCFAAFSLGDYALSLLEDIVPNQVPLIGRHGVLRNLTGKSLGAGWGGSIAFLFYALLRSYSGQTQALSATVARLQHEVEQRERSQHAAQESERQLRLVTDSIPAYVAYIDVGQKIRFLNKRNQEFKGLPQEEIVGRPLREVIGDARYEAIKPYIDVVLSGKAVTFEKSHDYPRHGARTVTSSFIPDVDEAGRVLGYYSVTIDVTELRASERQLRQLRDELLHAGRLSTMGEMAVGIAHELNQPLAAISTYCFAGRAVLQRSETPNEELQAILSKLEEQALRAGRIIERLRAMTRKTTSPRAAADVNRLVRDVVELTEAELRQQQIELVLNLGAQLPPVVVDVVQIQQVLLNLVQNAVDAMREAPPSRRRLEIETLVSGDACVEVVVRDSGCGISEEQERRLFSPFFTTKSNGTGMGLAISRSIVETHDGRIWVKRNAGQGVAVGFTLALGDEACLTS